MKAKVLDKFIHDQLSRWPLACENFRALKNVEVKDFVVGGLAVKAQFNPARIVSSAANVDKKAIEKRPCFLCADNRPKEQSSLRFEGRKGKKYDILVNPYPIFPDHLTIALLGHYPQSIHKRYVDILDLSRAYQGFTFFYNGPKCGASAPDHQHFQAAGNGMMPLESDVDALFEKILAAKHEAPEHRAEAAGIDDVFEYMASVQDAHLWHYRKFNRGIFALKGREPKSVAKLFYRLLDCAEIREGETEPRFNLITWYKSGEFRTVIVFRNEHRSHHYFSEGEDHLTMSPGCADVCGLLIVPRPEDFAKINAGLITEMLSEVCLSSEKDDQIVWKLTRRQPKLSVGIMSAPELEFEMISDSAGRQKATYREGKIDYNGALYDELVFDSQTPSTMFAEPTFILHNVVIGKGFHWQRNETQKFAGSLKIIVEHNNLTAINIIGVEDYLLSVISSEMKATSSEEFLKAHAVISRSWVMAQIQAHDNDRKSPHPEGIASTPQLVTYLDGILGESGPEPESETVPEVVKWYDHDDHKLFDVCADDHCQRYQGLTRATGETVRKVIDATWGQTLQYDGRICDARFSKCCGGVMEVFSACWGDVDYPYLQALPDTPDHDPAGVPFCNTSDASILSQVLNNYDLETPDFYRWKEEYDKAELAALIEKRSGRKIGRLLGLTPLDRGASGRIIRLEVKGDEGMFIVGKELEIRRTLSESHLKSSAFDVEDAGDRIVLNGLGWGHGVGLCQIGAAVMAAKGYNYRQILSHYYPGSEIQTR